VNSTKRRFVTRAIKIGMLMGALGLTLAMLGLGVAGFYVAAVVSGLFIPSFIDLPDRRGDRSSRR
jgi:hypothetical protein